MGGRAEFRRRWRIVQRSVSLALDGSGNVFVANPLGSVSELTAASGYGPGLNFAPAGAALTTPSR